MRVFITGASGWIGSAAVDELLGADHDVVGLARSDASTASLKAKGAQVRRGDLDDLDSIRAAAQDADAVVHLANKHDFENPEASNKAERDAVDAIGAVLAGSNRPFLLASGVTGVVQGRAATEQDPSPFHGPDSPRGGSENLALEYVQRGVHTVSVRFAPTVHGDGDHGFMAALVGVARGRALPDTSATVPTAGRWSTAPTPGVWCGSGWRRHRPGPCCTRWASRVCPGVRLLR